MLMSCHADRPDYTPAEWSTHVQAEGQLYFHEPHRRFVTEANIRKPERFRRISQWMLYVEKRAEARGIQITESTEIMLQLAQDDDSACGYYMIDHGTGSMFWLDEVSTEDLDILPVVSLNHLRESHGPRYGPRRLIWSYRLGFQGAILDAC